jgi:flagellar hook-associated protein 3 FlgL
MTISSSSPIVTSPTVMANSLIQDLSVEQNSMSSLEAQVASGNAIQTASDNPTGAASILQLQSSVTRSQQYVTNAQDGVGWLSTANSTVSSVLSTLQSVQQLVQSVSGVTLSGGSTAINGIASQVTGALNQLLDLANTQYAGGQPIFAGTGNATQAYDSSGNYLGSGNAPTRTVAPGTQVAVSITGPEVFGSGTSGVLSTVSGNQGVLSQIVSDLQSGNLTAVTGTDLQNLTSAISTVESAAATLGANQQAVEGFSTQATNTQTALQGELSSVQNVNMAEAITNLQLQQTSYQAALYATSQLNQQSLVQYL